jgi:hypothetical protein
MATPGMSGSVYAAIHWFALALEKRAIQLYATDASTYSAIREAFVAAGHKLGEVRLEEPEDHDCAPGTVWCADIQMCLPACAFFD